MSKYPHIGIPTLRYRFISCFQKLSVSLLTLIDFFGAWFNDWGFFCFVCVVVSLCLLCLPLISVCLHVSLPGASAPTSNSGPGHSSENPAGAVLLHRLHSQAAPQQGFHPAHHHLRSVIIISANCSFSLLEHYFGCWCESPQINSVLFPWIKKFSGTERWPLNTPKVLSQWIS